MPPNFLTNAYLAKTDEELLQLAGQQDQLTPEALAALQGELTRRHLSVTEAAPQTNDVPQLEEEAPPQQLLISVTKPHRIAGFIADVVHLYRRKFGLFLAVTAPGVIAGTMLVEEMQHVITPYLFRNDAWTRGQAGWLEIVLVFLVGYCLSFLLLFSPYPAICFAVDRINRGAEVSALNCLAILGRAFRPLFGFGMLAYLVILTVGVVTGFLDHQIYQALERHHLLLSPHLTLAIASATSIPGILVLSRFVLAVPAIVIDKHEIGAAVFRSDELTEGRWLTLAALLLKNSVMLAVPGAAIYGALLWISGNDAIDEWMMRVCLVPVLIVVEPMFYVGLALLYLQTSNSAAQLPVSPLQLAAQDLEEV